MNDHALDHNFLTNPQSMGTNMKQETIEQLMRVAGFSDKCCLALFADQVKAMLEAAYEAGQRDLPFMAKPLAYPDVDDLCKPHGI